MNWALLVLAGLFEVLWAIGMKYSHGFTKLYPSIFTVITMAISVLLLTKAIDKLPLSTAYAVWTAIGIVGTALFGMYYLNEPKSAIRIISIIFILAGIVGLRITAT